MDIEKPDDSDPDFSLLIFVLLRAKAKKEKSRKIQKELIKNIVNNYTQQKIYCIEKAFY